MTITNPEQITSIASLNIGHRAIIKGYQPGHRAYRHKLLAMGLTPGTEITLTRIAPLGDPVEIQVRGFALSLRKFEAESLLLVRKTIDEAAL